jgi:hypothetical protein
MWSQEQMQEGRKISQRIQQFRILFDYWEDKGFNETSNDITLFHMQEMAREILDSVRNHLRRFNIHSGITAEVVESLQ